MQNRTEIESLGEVGLIKRLTSTFKSHNPSTKLGVGDDAAAIKVDNNKQLVTSTELFIEGIHFDLSYFPLLHLGYKLVVAGISDIAAMNAIPSQIMVSIGMSNRFSVEAMEELYRGINAACVDYKLDLIGGDTSSARTGLILSITAFGQVEEAKMVFRSGAKLNDIVCTTGDFGGAYLGLQLLEREKAVFQANPEAQPQLDEFAMVIERQLKPNARIDLIHELAELGVVPTSMIDVSDGLASELLHICTASGTGATIFEDKLSIDDQSFLAATSLNISPVTSALNGGEDYEMLFTVSQSDFEKLKTIGDVNPIGFITDQKNEINLMMNSGQLVPLVTPGRK